MYYFIIFFLVLVSASYFGNYMFQKHHRKDLATDNGITLILGGLLSLLALIISFSLNTSINGYNARQENERNEAILIGNAFQYNDLLPEPDKAIANRLLAKYLDARINFYNSGFSEKRIYWKNLSLDKHLQLWNIGIKNVEKESSSSNIVVINKYSDLYVSHEKTNSIWNKQVPSLTWYLLILLAVSSCGFIGYSMKGTHNRNLLIIATPFFIAFALFIIADIDIPGEGIIHVTPVNLVNLKMTLRFQ